MILVNFKLYKETFGEGAIKLAKICKEVSELTGVKILPVVTALDAVRIKNEVGIEVLIQNVDEYRDGAKTGFVSATQAKEAGVKGSLLNHSEHQVSPGKVKKILKIWPENFVSVVCIDSLGKTERWAKNIEPDYIAYEPSYLIGDSTRSVATEKPEVIKKIVEKYSKVPILVGAGIHDKNDVKVSLSLGAKGILISSGVVMAKNQRDKLIELASAFLV